MTGVCAFAVARSLRVGLKQTTGLKRGVLFSAKFRIGSHFIHIHMYTHYAAASHPAVQHSHTWRPRPQKRCNAPALGGDLPRSQRRRGNAGGGKRRLRLLVPPQDLLRRVLERLHPCVVRFELLGEQRARRALFGQLGAAEGGGEPLRCCSEPRCAGLRRGLLLRVEQPCLHLVRVRVRVGLGLGLGLGIGLGLGLGIGLGFGLGCRVRVRVRVQG